MEIFSGIVKRGSGQATAKFRLPTANIAIKHLPTGIRPGVYASRCSLGDQRCNGLTFIGQAHLLPGKPWRLETHLFDTEGNFVGQTLQVELVQFIRAPLQFRTQTEAFKVIQTDILAARSYFAQS